jgi:hypothetical protein
MTKMKSREENLMMNQKRMLLISLLTFFGEAQASGIYESPEDWFAGLNAEMERGEGFHSEGTPPNEASPSGQPLLETFPIGANSGSYQPRLRGLSPSDGPKPKKLSRDPLLSSLQQMRRLSLATPENLARTEKENQLIAQKQERKEKRNEDTPWANFGNSEKHGFAYANFGLSGSNSLLTVGDSAPPSAKISGVNANFDGMFMIDSSVGESEVVHSLQSTTFSIDYFYEKKINGISQRNLNMKMGYQDLFYAKKSSPEDENLTKFGVTAGIQGEIDLSQGARSNKFTAAGLVASFGPDFQRLLFQNSKKVVSFQFLPALGFYGTSFDITQENADGTETLITKYKYAYSDSGNTEFKNNFASGRYGMVGKLYLEPGVMIDVLWLRSFKDLNTNYSSEDYNNYSQIVSGKVDRVFHGDVFIRLTKRVNLNGSYRWTRFNDSLTERPNLPDTVNGDVKRQTISLQQAKIGITITVNKE